MVKTIRALVVSLAFPVLYHTVQLLISRMGLLIYVMGLDPAMADEAYIAAQKDFVGRAALYFLALSAVITLFVVFWAARRRSGSLARDVGLAPPAASSAAVLLVLGVLVNLIIAVFLALLPIPERFLQENQSVADTLTSQGPVAAFLIGSLLLPVAEEFVFRGMCHRALRGGFSVRAAVVIQALIFAVFHFNVLQAFYVFPVAILLGLVYEWSGTLWAPILLHIAFNGGNEILDRLLTGLPDMVSGWVVLLSVPIAALCLRKLHGDAKHRKDKALR